jgi:hypothetical protein
MKIFSAFAFFKAPCTPYRGGVKNIIIKILHSHVFVLASLLHIKIHKNTWAHEGPHISKKKPKRSGHMKAHNIIL